MRSFAASLSLSAVTLLTAAAQDVVEVTKPSEPTEAAAAKERPKDAAALFTAFAGMKGLEASFEEEKHIALLAAPLESRGTLYYLSPGYLARVVDTPEPALLRITPDELTIEGAEGVERVDLRRSDHVRRFVTSLVQVFAGDREALERAYEVRYGPDPKVPDDSAAWRLALVPREKPLTEMLKELRLSGEGLRVRSIEVLEPSGDRTVTRILEADPARRFTPEEKQRWFGIEP